MGAQFSEAGLNGALMKKKKKTHKTNKDKKWRTKYDISKGGSFRVRSKVPF